LLIGAAFTFDYTAETVYKLGMHR